jgi:predicted Zn-dependent protease
MMKTLLKTSLYISLLTATACGSDGTERTRIQGTNFGGEVSTGQSNVAPDGSGNPDGLAAHLFTEQDAKEISPLVMAYKQSSTKAQNATQDASLNSERDFIKETLDAMMELTSHSPGRDFTITVTGDSAPNASALNQSLVVNKGIIDFASNLSLAMVLCHEVAHSTRNHSYRAEAEMQEYENKNKTKSDKLDSTLAELVAKNYDKEKGIFSHKKEDYQKVKPVWDAFWDGFIGFQKRFESEADVVGGRICANSGFTADEVEQGFITLFAKFGGSTATKSIDDQQFPVQQDEIGQLLHTIYASSSHPTDAERSEQIARIRPAFQEGASKTISDRWKKSFPGKSGLSLLPSNLTSGQLKIRHLSPIDSIVIRRTQSGIDR